MNTTKSATLTIGDVARMAGVRPSAIRFYESEGLLPPPVRQGGKRRYESGILHWLAFILFAQRAGFTVAEIRELAEGLDMSAPPSDRWRALAERKLTEVHALVRHAQEMERWLEEGLRCGCLSLEECSLVMRASGVDGASTPAVQPDGLPQWRFFHNAQHRTEGTAERNTR